MSFITIGLNPKGELTISNADGEDILKTFPWRGRIKLTAHLTEKSCFQIIIDDIVQEFDPVSKEKIYHLFFDKE